MTKTIYLFQCNLTIYIIVSSHKIFNYYIFMPKIWIKMSKNFILKIIWSQRETLSPLLFHLPPFVLYFNKGKIGLFEKNLPSSTYWNIIFIPPELTEIWNLGWEFILNSFSSVNCMQFYNGNMCVVNVIVIMSQFQKSKESDFFINYTIKR